MERSLFETLTRNDCSICLVCLRSRFSHFRFFVTLGLQPTGLLCPWDFPIKNIGVGCHALLQGLFLTQGSNQSPFCLLHWQTGSIPLVPPGKPSDTLHFTQCYMSIKYISVKKHKKNPQNHPSFLFQFLMRWSTCRISPPILKMLQTQLHKCCNKVSFFLTLSS